MAKNDNLKDFLTDVADAIREKKGTTDLINPQDFSAEIASIKSGGGAVAVSAKAVNFRDYDGTILHSYTKDEFLTLSELPPLPTREGLICQEWNWDFADAVEYVTEYGVLEVGATYITDDGKTRVYIKIIDDAVNEVRLNIGTSSSSTRNLSIDWGDGSEEENFSLKGDMTFTHSYQKGEYCIRLYASGSYWLGHTSSSISTIDSAYDSDGKTRNRIWKVEMGTNLKIQSYTFYKLNSLESVSISKGSASSNTYAFSNCYSLAYIALPRGITSIEKGMLVSCYGLKNISLPKSITKIEGYAFSGARNLLAINLPQGLLSLGENSFATAYTMGHFSIPASIATINAMTFSECYPVYFDFSRHEAIPSLSSTSAFSATSYNYKIVVPDALYDTWIASTNWSTYASKIIKKSEWDALNA